MIKSTRSLRKSRTRTLIQLGGLLQKSGILESFDISVGDDLQGYENLRKSATLLGFLLTSSDQDLEVSEKQEYWKNIGRSVMGK